MSILSIQGSGVASHRISRMGVAERFGCQTRSIQYQGTISGTLLDRYLESGQHYIVWDAGSLSIGVYFYLLRTDEFTATNKMILLK